MRGLSFTIEGRSLAAYRALGMRGFAHLLASKLRIEQRSTEFAVAPQGFAHPVHLRAGTSDIATFMQIFHDLEYQLEGFGPVRNIIDAGANIGLSTVFFAHRYRLARVVALEPEDSNFRLLQRNTAPYKGVIPMKAALWCSDGALALTDPGLGEWGYQVTDDTPGGRQTVIGRVDALTVNTVMKRAGFEHVDILKLDIEGAEKEVLEASTGWIDNVRLLVVELHDRIKPGCSRSFYNATNGFDAEWRRGEHVFVSRMALGSAPGQLSVETRVRAV